MTSTVNNPQLSPLAAEFLAYVQDPEMAHTVAFAEGTFNPVDPDGQSRSASSCSRRKSSTRSSGTAWKRRWRRSVEYDIVPDYDKLLDIMTAAKREASGG